jgi:hypothetical protein
MVEVVDELGEPTGALGPRPRLLAEGRGVPPDPAGADAERQPAAGDVVEGHGLLGQRDRVPEVRRGHERPEAQRGRDPGGRRQQGSAESHGPSRRSRQVRWS